MNDPQTLRVQAVEFHALARQIRDDAPAYADLLMERAKELRAQAAAIEEANKASDGR